jgi:hypothetical protein
MATSGAPRVAQNLLEVWMETATHANAATTQTLVLDCRIIRYTGPDLDEYSPEFLELLQRQREEGYSLASIRWEGDRPEIVFQRTEPL